MLLASLLSLLLASSFTGTQPALPECWELTLTVRVPRIYDNTESLGYRKYQTQKIRGYFTVQQMPYAEPVILFCSLENRTHKINGKPVTYDAWIDDEGGTMWHVIGNNRTGVFKTRSVALKLWAEPSYAIGPEPTEDNSLILVLSGYGNSSGNRITGYVAGQIGCGCKEYGHVSPTRIWGTDRVVDTAAVFGKWYAKRVQ